MTRRTAPAGRTGLRGPGRLGQTAWPSDRADPAVESLPMVVLGATLLGAVSALAGGMAAGSDLVRVGIAVCVGLLLLGLGLHSRTYLLVALVVWLSSLGLLRRLVSVIEPAGDLDPLLLVGPLAVVALVVVSWHMGAFQRRTTLANAVLAFSAIGLVSAANPFQGGLAIGLAGLLLVVLPTAGFWIGRSLARREMRAVLVTVAALAIPAALYGVRQTFGAFPSWDVAWAETSGYTSLVLHGEVLRPFSSFSSVSEFAFFLACGLVVWLALGLRSSRLVPTLAVLALLAVGVWYTGIRTVVVTTVVAVVVMTAASRRWSFRRAICVVVVVAVGVPALLGAALTSSAPPSSDPSALSNRQAGFFADPLDPENSTLGVHLAIAVEGVKSSLAAPLGHGAGSVTIATAKFDGVSRNAETDISNAAVAFGLPGLAFFVAVIVLGLRTVYRLAAHHRDRLAMAALGVAVVTLFSWLAGGQYAVALLPWLVLGWSDRELQRAEANASIDSA